MALSIIEFAAVGVVNNFGLSSLPPAPIVVTNAASGPLVLNAATRMIAIKGSGTITWAGIAGAEPFSSLEFRSVVGGSTITCG